MGDFRARQRPQPRAEHTIDNRKISSFSGTGVAYQHKMKVAMLARNK